MAVLFQCYNFVQMLETNMPRFAITLLKMLSPINVSFAGENLILVHVSFLVCIKYSYIPYSYNFCLYIITVAIDGTIVAEVRNPAVPKKTS